MLTTWTVVLVLLKFKTLKLWSVFILLYLLYSWKLFSAKQFGCGINCSLPSLMPSQPQQFVIFLLIWSRLQIGNERGVSPVHRAHVITWAHSGIFFFFFSLTTIKEHKRVWGNIKLWNCGDRWSESLKVAYKHIVYMWCRIVNNLIVSVSFFTILYFCFPISLFAVNVKKTEMRELLHDKSALCVILFFAVAHQTFKMFTSSCINEPFQSVSNHGGS